MGPREKCASSKISTGILSNTSRCTAKDSKNSFQFYGFSATAFRVNLIFCIVLQHPVIILLSSCVIAHPLNFKLWSYVCHVTFSIALQMSMNTSQSHNTSGSVTPKHPQLPPSPTISPPKLPKLPAGQHQNTHLEPSSTVMDYHQSLQRL